MEIPWKIFQTPKLDFLRTMLCTLELKLLICKKTEK